MKEKFSEKHVAWLVMLEHDILRCAKSKGHLTSAKEETLIRWGLDVDSYPDPPWLQLRILSIGYLAFVFPKELWKDQHREISIELEKLSSDLPKKDKTLRKLRNAFAHADLEVSSKELVYWHRPKGCEKETLKMSIEVFMKMINILTPFFLSLAKPPE